MINKLMNMTKVKQEINELKTWFTSYDIQVQQYQRDLRVYGESKIDIVALDAEAIKKAAKIRELRESISELENLLKSKIVNIQK